MTLNSKTEPHRRQSIFRALQGQVVVMLLVLMLVGIAALVWNLSRLSSELVRSSTLRDAKRYNQALNPHFQFDFGIPTLQRPSASLFIGVQALSGRTEANTQWVKKKTSRFSSPSTDF